MGSVSGRHRRITFPEVEQAELRGTLISRYRDDTRYRNITERDLRPLWKAVEAPLAALVRNPTDIARIEDIYDDQVGAEEDGGGPHDRDLAAYVEALRRFVGGTMRLAHGGDPAFWAMPLVHGDVIGQPHWPVSASFYGAEEATIALKVTPAYGRVEVRGADGETLAATELDAAGFDFDWWPELEAVARDLLGQQFARLRRDFDQRYPEERYPRRNPATQQKWHREDVPALFGLLFHRRRSVSPSRETIVRLAERIGVDLPST